MIEKLRIPIRAVLIVLILFCAVACLSALVAGNFLNSALFFWCVVVWGYNFVNTYS